MHIFQTHDHMPFLDHYFISDRYSIPAILHNNLYFIGYDNNDPFWKQYTDGLAQVPTKYVLTMFEDQILYGDVDEENIQRYVDYMENNENTFFVRLQRSDIHEVKYIQDDLIEINPNSHYFYSMIPTIHNRENLIKCIEDSQIETVFHEMRVGNSFRKFDVKGVCAYKDQPMAGKNHWWADGVFSVCEVIARGKWIGLYKDIWGPLCEQYGIDPNVRGIRN